MPHGTPRFIPAGAGNTINRSRRIILPPVYPRWRGEHTITSVSVPRASGDKPILDHAFTEVMVETQNFRFIPAGAGNTKFILINTAFVSVYPRWRGEHFTTIGGHATAHGLSPLARGTQIWGAPLMKSKRFIPAGAGNTAADSRAGHHRPVYPRWRGEHQLSDVSLAWRHGLSPLARGTPVHIRFLVARSRFIPAGAGNTDQIPVPQSTPSVYPRWRGEHN